MSNNPHIVVNIFSRNTMSSKKHVNLLFFYSPKLAVTQYSVMIHFLKYLNVNVIWKVIPEQLNIISSEIALGDVDFPLDIKICAGYLTPISMDRAGSTAQYEYTFNSGIVANVAEVMNKVRNHGEDDVAEKISIDLENQSKGTLKVGAQLKRLNFPQNCNNVNLTVVNRARAGTVRTICMHFKTGKVNKVVIRLQGKTLASNRKIKTTCFYTKGDQISVERGNFRKCTVKISRDVFLEKDKSKNCQNYPNLELASYKECDEQYMKNI